MNATFRTEVKVNPPADEVTALEERLRAYNRSRVENSGHLSLLITLIDSGDRLIGGVFGKISYGWLFVETIWVAEQNREHGHGGKLLRKIEEEARRSGCLNSWLDTFSFQARSFYEKNGYVVFGELSDYPLGHTRYFLRKSL
jgi:GNAT superfamily N-acetyltransferase